MAFSKYKIVTSSKIMKALGLSSFTFDSLQEWMEYNDGFNLNYIKFGDNLPKDPTSADYIKELLYNKPEDSDFMYISDRSTADPTDIAKDIHYDGPSNGWKSRNQKYDFKSLVLGEDYLKVTNTKGYSDNFAWRLVRINDFIQDTDTEIFSSSDRTGTKYLARKALVRDILHTSASEYGGDNKMLGVRWKSLVTFNIDRSKQCEVEIEFNLKLFTSARPDTDAVVVTNIRRGVSIDEHGRPISGPVGPDGRTAIIEGSTGSNVDAEVDRYFNPVTKKWESGTTSAIGIMKSDCEAANIPDSIDLENPEPQPFLAGFGPAYGEVYILSSNDSRWDQWCPNYKILGSKDQVDGDDEKDAIFTVPVQNKSKVAFAKGQIVKIEKINGAWQPISFGDTPTVAVDAPVTTVVDSWNFTYLMTNANYFFKNPLLFSSLIKFEDYEEEYYKLYYGVAEITTPLYTHQTENSHVQVTSFDFMGASIGGQREGHGLCNTQIGLRADETEEENIVNLTPITAPFFGCVFPDGYVEDKYNLTTTVNKSTTNSEFIAEIPAGISLFAPGDTGAGTNSEGDIFQKGLSQLPADIATNCGPDTKDAVGTPITYMSNLAKYFYDFSKLDDFLSNNSIDGNDNPRYVWSHSEGDPTDSTFNISPKNSQKIQFRPLKAEVYASPELYNYEAVNAEDKGYFARIAFEKTGNEPPFNKTSVFNRLYSKEQEPIGGIIVKGITGGTFTSKYFGYNSDIIADGNVKSDSSAFPNGYWRNTVYNWMASGPRPAGAMGIIGAKCSITAKTSINFETTYIFGMDDEFLGFNALTGNLWGQTFGGANTYTAHNNTGLFARVYTSWPNHLTVYDARYFAVFHFNYGVGETGNFNVPDDEEWTYYNGDDVVSKDEWVEGDKKVGDDYDTAYYAVQKLKYTNSDFREPTLNHVNAFHPESVVGEGEPIYSDGAGAISQSEVDGEYKYSPAKGGWRDYDHWRVNTSSRGKLLPVPTGKLTRRTIGINNKPSYGGSSWSIRIYDGGSFYSETDRFTTFGGSGEGVTLVPIVEGGVIVGFDFDHDESDIGYDFLPEDFFSAEDYVNLYGLYPEDVNLDRLSLEEGYNISKITIVKKGDVTGKALKAYVTTGLSYDKDIADDIKYPKVADSSQTNGIRMIENAPVNKVENDQTMAAYNSSYPTTFTIDNHDENNKYDCFFFYYNDISHVFIEPHGFSPVVNEQYVELQITSE